MSNAAPASTNKRAGGEAFVIDMGPPKRNTTLRKASVNVPSSSQRADAATPPTVRKLSVTPPVGGQLMALPSEPPVPTPPPPPCEVAPRAAKAGIPPAAATPGVGVEVRPTVRGGGGESDDDVADGPTSADWKYDPPPNNQRSFTLPVSIIVEGQPTTADITFSSAFDSGNMINVVCPTPNRFEIHTASDCQNSAQEVSNKAWWYFSVTGVPRGVTLSFTVVSVPWCRSFTYGYAPVVACCPLRPIFARMSNRITVVPAANPPPLRPPASGWAASASASAVSTPPLQELDLAAVAPLAGVAPLAAKKSSNPSHVDISFDFTFESDELSAAASLPPGRSLSCPVTYFFANTFPYSYARLQRHLAAWVPHCPVLEHAPASHQPDLPGLAVRLTPPTSADGSTPLVGASAQHRIYTHRELLNLTLDGNRVDVLTITGSSGMHAKGEREPMFSPTAPLSSAWGLSGPGSTNSSGEAVEGPAEAMRATLATVRPISFPDKRYVVLSARVHPGEVPASHILQGAIEFLLNPTDPRAEALRRHYVFIIVPMLNPDGVARGHSRADTVGQNLNRMYKNPCPRKQPTCVALRELLLSVEKTKRLALYMDLHAHSNKKGAFLFGNAMNAIPQVQNLLYARLLSLNSPYVDFASCNFSEHNMFVVGKGGGGKDGSSRVMLFAETGFTHSYTLEMNYITGPPLNPVAPLANGVPGEETEITVGTPCPKYGLPCFHDVGRGIVVSLLDLQNINPMSRLPQTSFRNARGVALWIQRALLVDAWEQQRRMQALAQGIPLSVALGAPRGGEKDGLGFVPCAPNELPAVVTTRPSPSFPPTTTHRLSDLAVAFNAGSLATPAVEGRGAAKAAAAVPTAPTRSKSGSRLAPGGKQSAGTKARDGNGGGGRYGSFSGANKGPTNGPLHAL